MPVLYLHVKISTKGFQNLGACIVLTYDKDDGHGVISRCMKQRGVEYQFEASRHASDKEFSEEEGKGYRVRFIQYRDWDRLIADERKFQKDFGIDESWFGKLEELKNKYPQFKENPKTELEQPEIKIA